ncbi:39 kDa FK506-binding nuclear protein [Scaptodrosophila lebanonensis]|uniref:peptidylprolyl isomerase n=1 Tax=Drosophila lebanonensis TaxID=7225 RepID=A0A6J2SY52_DROLE|nr:39 kDa FK506-binding nuclear protein [Scaptodrosophila lebanonensis]
MSSMFWGLHMEPNRKYSQAIRKSFHISGVALDKGDSAKLYITADTGKYLVATLSKDIPQVQLDLNFSKGDKIVFQNVGKGTMSVLGYLHDMDDDDDDSLDEEEYASLAEKLGKKKGAIADDDDDEEDDDDVDDSQLLNALNESFVDDEDDESGDEEDDELVEEEEESDESGDDLPEPPKAKHAKVEPAKKPTKEQNGVAKKEIEKPKAKKEKKDATEGKPKKEQLKEKIVTKQAEGERTIAGGVKIEDLHVGSGPEAKAGKRASVYYIGRLKSNNKTFDSMQKGNGFKFSIGKGEVIKGWDVGVVGMKVGGKRRITCPPHMAYGSRGQPPVIPPNSTLVFDVELKNTN